jgi:hypothetical protein
LSALKFPPEMPEDVIEAFFGSRENPALGSIPTPDRRFYFYFFKDRGPLAKYGLKGYNRETRETFTVADLGTSFFSN